jgi:hypothetical protein
VDITEEFKNHADECRRMARFSRDPSSSATWKQMAERWERAAEQQMASTRAAGAHRAQQRAHRH